MGKHWKQCQTLFYWGSKITTDGDCSHEMKRRLLLGKKVMTNLDSIFKSRDAAYAYLTAHPNTICIATGGKGSDENLSGAQCIYNHLTAMGIDKDRIWLEDTATSTIENFQYSVQLLQEKNGSIPGSVSVLSNEFHLFRASLMAEDAGLSPNFVAAPTTDIASRVNYTMQEIFALWKYLIIGG